jgi:hypothetical protein
VCGLNKIRNGGNAASFLRVNRRRVAFAATSISRAPSHREALPAGERKFQGDVGEVSGLARHFAQEAAPVICAGILKACHVAEVSGRFPGGGSP